MHSIEQGIESAPGYPITAGLDSGAGGRQMEKLVDGSGAGVGLELTPSSIAYYLITYLGLGYMTKMDAGILFRPTSMRAKGYEFGR